MSMRSPLDARTITGGTAYSGNGKLAQVRIVAASAGGCDAYIRDGGATGTVLVSFSVPAGATHVWDAPRSGDIPFSTDLYVSRTGTAPLSFNIYHRDP